MKTINLINRGQTVNTRWSRRSFLKAGAVLGAFTVVPRHVLGGAGQASPNSKLNIAGVGIGGQGGWDLEEWSAATRTSWPCAMWTRITRAKPSTNIRSQTVSRISGEMLDKEKSIDAVVVANPGPQPRHRVHGRHQARASMSIAKSR